MNQFRKEVQAKLIERGYSPDAALKIVAAFKAPVDYKPKALKEVLVRECSHYDKRTIEHITDILMELRPKSGPADLQESFKQLYLSEGETVEEAEKLAKVAAGRQPDPASRGEILE